jgi:hypothetical protein
MHGHAIHVLPTTRLGRRAILVATGYILFMPLWVFLPGGATLALACGVAGGVGAIVAVKRDHERGLLAYLAIIPLVLVVSFILAEFLLGHP